MLISILCCAVLSSICGVMLNLVLCIVEFNLVIESAKVNCMLCSAEFNLVVAVLW